MTLDNQNTELEKPPCTGSTEYPCSVAYRKRVVIGECVLYLGDCLEIMHHLESATFDSIITDPPYGISLAPPRKKTKSIANDGRKEAERLWTFMLPQLYRLAKDDTSHVFWTGWSETWTKELLEKAFRVKSCIVWGKNNFGIGYYTRPQHEMAWYCHKGNPEKPHKAMSDLWLVPRIQAPIHSCEKPRRLLEMSIELCGGKTILDPFMGVGSCGMAAISRGKAYTGIEIDEGYFEKACERIETAYRTKPRLFDEISKPKQAEQLSLL